MAIQFCKIQETSFRKIVVIDELPVKINALFSVTPCIFKSFKNQSVCRTGFRNRNFIFYDCGIITIYRVSQN
jgi:hypothetical protein